MTFSAQISGADSVTWEVAPEPGGPWTVVDGQHQQSWTVDSVTREQFNDRFIRMSGSNGAGTVSAGSLYVRTVPFAALRVEEQPEALRTIAGNRAVLAFTAEGSPPAKTFGVEQSRDGGVTWAPVDGAEHRKWQFGKLDRMTMPQATVADHGTLVRGTAETAAGERVVTEAVGYSVVEATGKPQLHVWKLPGFTPEVGGMLAVSGAGFQIPDRDQGGSYSLGIGLFATDS